MKTMTLLTELTSIPAATYAQATGIFIGTYLALYIFRTYLISRLERMSAKTTTQLDDALIEIIRSITWPFYIITPLYIASLTLPLPQLIAQGMWLLFLLTASIYIIRVLQQLLISAINATTKGKDKAIVQLLGSLVKGILWVLLFLMILSNLGINITSLVAGVGIGGIALALAAQSILSDLFSAFSIYFDKPFEVGDTIKVGNDTGTVEKIGIKSTRLRTLQGEQMVISNQELTTARIQNFKRLKERAVYYRFGVTYDTPSATLEKIPDIVTNALTSLQGCDVNRVHFVSLGDSALIFELMYTVHSDDFTNYLNAQQAINLALVKAFQAEGINFAFPSQTIYLKQD